MKEDYPRTLMELEQRFCDETGCRAYPFGLRWPQGFVCPACDDAAGEKDIRQMAFDDPDLEPLWNDISEI